MLLIWQLRRSEELEKDRVGLEELVRKQKRHEKVQTALGSSSSSSSPSPSASLVVLTCRAPNMAGAQGAREAAGGDDEAVRGRGGGGGDGGGGSRSGCGGEGGDEQEGQGPAEALVSGREDSCTLQYNYDLRIEHERGDALAAQHFTQDVCQSHTEP